MVEQEIEDLRVGGSTPSPKICTSTSGSHVATEIIGHDNLLAVVVRTACLCMDHTPFLDYVR